MIVVTNRIKTKLGFAEKMAPLFTKSGVLQTFEGFSKVEVLITQKLTEYDELNVNMYWDNMEHFMKWKNSDAFKEAHKGSGTPEGDSPILGSQIVVSKVASVLESPSEK